MNWRMKQRFWLVKDSGYSSIQQIFENRKYVLSNVIGNVNVRVIWMHSKAWKLNDKFKIFQWIEFIPDKMGGKQS